MASLATADPTYNAKIAKAAKRLLDVCFAFLAHFLHVSSRLATALVARTRGRSVSVDHRAMRRNSRPTVRALSPRRRSRGVLVNRYQALLLPRVIPASRIAGTVIAAIENLRPGVDATHRPHGDGGSPDADRPLPVSASGVARDPTSERAAHRAAGNLRAARRSGRLRSSVIRADGRPRGPFARMTEHRRTP